MRVWHVRRARPRATAPVCRPVGPCIEWGRGGAGEGARGGGGGGACAAAFQIKCSLRRTANTAPRGECGPPGGILSTFSSRAAAVRARLARAVSVGSGRGREGGEGSAHRGRWRASLSSPASSSVEELQTHGVVDRAGEE